MLGVRLFIVALVFTHIHQVPGSQVAMQYRAHPRAYLLKQGLRHTEIPCHNCGHRVLPELHGSPRLLLQDLNLDHVIETAFQIYALVPYLLISLPLVPMSMSW